MLASLQNTSRSKSKAYRMYSMQKERCQVLYRQPRAEGSAGCRVHHVGRHLRQNQNPGS